MVKNNTGGNKAKGFARKNMIKKTTALRVANDEGEIYAQAIKVMGGSIASAIDINGNPLRVHIRGKFRGRGKRDNFISPNTWILVGLHEWQGDKSSGGIIDCDILEVYNDSDKVRLINSINHIDWSIFIMNDSKTIGDNENKNKDTSGITFADDDTQEYDKLITEQISQNVKMSIITEDNEIINVDDI